MGSEKDRKLTYPSLENETCPADQLLLQPILCPKLTDIRVITVYNPTSDKILKESEFLGHKVDGVITKKKKCDPNTNSNQNETKNC